MLTVWYGVFRDPLLALVPGWVSGRVPSRRRWTWPDLFWVPVSAGLGAGSHVLWDSFTHNRSIAIWGWEWLDARPIAGLAVFDALQYLSSIAGLAVIVWWAARRPMLATPSLLPHESPATQCRARGGRARGVCLLDCLRLARDRARVARHGVRSGRRRCHRHGVAARWLCRCLAGPHGDPGMSGLDHLATGLHLAAPASMRCRRRCGRRLCERRTREHNCKRYPPALRFDAGRCCPPDRRDESQGLRRAFPVHAGPALPHLPESRRPSHAIVTEAFEERPPWLGARRPGAGSGRL